MLRDGYVMHAALKRVFITINFLILLAGQNLAQRAESHYATDNYRSNRSLKKTLYVPIALVAAGILATTDNDIVSNEDVFEARQRALPKFTAHADDYLQYAPIAALIGLNAAGIKGVNRLNHSLLVLLRSEVIMGALVFPLKRATHVLRPDGSAYTSFPSGHTAQAFLGATIIHKEFGHINRWYSIVAYATATSVGVLRILNNRHWTSDVLAGAGLGVLSVQLSFFIQDRIMLKKNVMSLSPFLFDRSLGGTLLIKL